MMRPASDRDASIGDRSAMLRLRVEQPFTTAQTAEMGYVARVRDVTPGRPQAERDSVSEVVVPVGGGGFRELAVRPGSYLIEAVTPSGSVLEADVEVGDGESQAVNLADDTPSPHEWLGWQKVSGNLPGYTASVAVAVKRKLSLLWPLIGAGVLLLVLAALAVGWVSIQGGSARPTESVNAPTDYSEDITAESGAMAPAPAAVGAPAPAAVPKDPASEMASPAAADADAAAAAAEDSASDMDAPGRAPAEAVVPRRAIIARASPGRSPASRPDNAFAPPEGGRTEIQVRPAIRRSAVRPPGGGAAPPAPMPPPPPEASGSGAPPPEPLPTAEAPMVGSASPTAAAPPVAEPPEAAPSVATSPAPPPAEEPKITGAKVDEGMPGWFWLVGLGLLTVGGGGGTLAARRGMIPGLGPRLTPAAEPTAASAIFKSALPEGVPMAPGSTAVAEAPPPVAAGPARLTLLTLPSGPGEWAMMLAALESRAALTEAYAASQGPGREPQAEGGDAQWSTYATLPLNAAGDGRPLWAVDSPAAGRAEAVRLPEAWVTPDSGQAVPIEILTAAEGRDERVSTAVRDPQYGTLLGYLALGRLPEARALLGQAAEALFGKTINPYLAAAGGYVLIGSATTFDDAPWRGWLQTLDVQYPWLPDAAVLQAVSMVQTRQEGIRAKVLEAMDRGVPVYTEGLKRLRDLLTLLVEQPDPDGRVAQSLDAVSRLAGRCNPQQVFTSLRLGA